ncbi:MAG: acyl-CoA dehydrogenase [Gammaproteobacteria bacterium]|nr:MAG: acyl-CoA dehydrogenase [Gammaproteobacteria bacterium]RLA50693.1 MAG: acyl-CoA dehydrogenase [Gammaproteobacteria bacterium]
MSEIEIFRKEVREWLQENCPESLRRRWPDPFAEFSVLRKLRKGDSALWLEAMIKKGWTAPTWPVEYGGGGLTRHQNAVLQDEMVRISAPEPLLGMGLSMIGPTLLDLGTDAQKQAHLPGIITGDSRWCQGYSEPNAGSDLANIQTKAEDKGDHFIINGSKTWTSGGHLATWMFCLVRTGKYEKKQQGISFLLFEMDQPGITLKPIKLISGDSPFCETFFDDVKALKENLIGKLDDGWAVGKRLLQHERSSIGSSPSQPSGENSKVPQLVAMAKQYHGEVNGRIDNPELRTDIIRHLINTRAFKLTLKRAFDEAKAGASSGETSSMFKFYGSENVQVKHELMLEAMGTNALAWEGEDFSSGELETLRTWLGCKATTIYGGSSEIQLNIIAKRVLGLPE